MIFTGHRVMLWRGAKIVHKSLSWRRRTLRRNALASRFFSDQSNRSQLPSQAQRDRDFMKMDDYVKSGDYAGFRDVVMGQSDTFTSKHVGDSLLALAHFNETRGVELERDILGTLLRKMENVKHVNGDALADIVLACIKMNEPIPDSAMKRLNYIIRGNRRNFDASIVTRVVKGFAAEGKQLPESVAQELNRMKPHKVSSLKDSQVVKIVDALDSLGQQVSGLLKSRYKKYHFRKEIDYFGKNKTCTYSDFKAFVQSKHEMFNESHIGFMLLRQANFKSEGIMVDDSVSRLLLDSACRLKKLSDRPFANIIHACGVLQEPIEESLLSKNISTCGSQDHFDFIGAASILKTFVKINTPLPNMMIERFENLPEDTLNRIGPKELNAIVEGLMALGQAVPDKMYRKYESAMLLQQINECRFKLEHGYDQFMPLVLEKQHLLFGEHLAKSFACMKSFQNNIEGELPQYDEVMSILFGRAEDLDCLLVQDIFQIVCTCANLNQQIPLPVVQNFSEIMEKGAQEYNSKKVCIAICAYVKIGVPLPDTLLQQLQKFTRSDTERLGLSELKEIRKQMLDGEQKVPQLIEERFLELRFNSKIRNSNNYTATGYRRFRSFVIKEIHAFSAINIALALTKYAKLYHKNLPKYNEGEVPMDDDFFKIMLHGLDSFNTFDWKTIGIIVEACAAVKEPLPSSVIEYLNNALDESSKVKAQHFRKIVIGLKCLKQFDTLTPRALVNVARICDRVGVELPDAANEKLMEVIYCDIHIFGEPYSAKILKDIATPLQPRINGRISALVTKKQYKNFEKLVAEQHYTFSRANVMASFQKLAEYQEKYDGLEVSDRMRRALRHIGDHCKDLTPLEVCCIARVFKNLGEPLPNSVFERSTELPTLYQLDDERVLYKTEDVYTMLLLYDDLKIHMPKSLLKRIEGFTEEDFTACDVPRLLEILVNTGTPTPEPLMNLLYSLTTEELEGFKTAEVAAIYNSLVSLGEFVPRPIFEKYGSNQSE